MSPQRMTPHQYIERHSGRVVTERLIGDRIINALYASVRESPHWLFSAVTSRWVSSLLGAVHYDLLPMGSPIVGRRFMERCGIDPGECLEPPESFRTARQIFERQIRYWECRPMAEEPSAVVSPADARMLMGSLAEVSCLFVKGKFFDLEELLGPANRQWLSAFAGGDFAVFRLTPDKYHYSHMPVSGRVEAIYGIEGRFHSCNPGAVVVGATPYSKNRRVVTIIDTDVPGGTGAGRVAMIEVVALMIGEVVQCYSAERYSTPCPLAPGLFVEKGAPKSLYRPGSSTDLLLFEPGRIRFDEDLLDNLRAQGVQSRFSLGLGRPLVETDLKVRSRIATAQGRPPGEG